MTKHKTSEPTTVEIHGATFTYAGHAALTGVDFTLGSGNMLALAGPNGGGKSTLLRGLLHLVDATGDIRVLGDPPKQARRQCGYVPQADNVDPDFPISALGVVLMGVGRRTGPALWPRTRDRATARSALHQVGLDGHERRPFSVLSGGQRQRLLVARALASHPEVLLLDEPFSGVDAASARIIEDSLAEIRQRGGTVLVSTHDHEFARRACSHSLLLNRTQYGFGPCDDVLTSTAVAGCYTGQTPEVGIAAEGS